MKKSPLIKRAKRVFLEEGLIIFLKKIIRVLITPLILIYLFFKVKTLKNSKDELLDQSYSGFIGGWYGKLKPSQVKEEFSLLLDRFQNLKPKNILEIGTANGGTLLLFIKLSYPEARIVSIDLPNGKFGGGYSKWRIPLYKSFKNKSVFLIRKNSQIKSTLQEVRKIFNEVDFLFIDADHTYEGVKRDFELYAPLVKKGGIIAFHDIVKHSPETGVGIDIFWKEIKNLFETEEFIEDKGQGWAGIGVIKNVIPSKIKKVIKNQTKDE